MASFMQNASQTGFDAQSYTNNVTSNRQANRSGSNLSAGSNGFFGLGATPGNIAESSYSVVGINTSQIPNMRAAIRNYVSSIQEHLSNVRTETDPTVALKGTGMENAVKEYISSVVHYCEALCSNLLAFSDKLAKVQEAWENSDANMASTVNNAASDVSGSVQSGTYEEQF